MLPNINKSKMEKKTLVHEKVSCRLPANSIFRIFFWCVFVYFFPPKGILLTFKLSDFYLSYPLFPSLLLCGSASQLNPTPASHHFTPNCLFAASWKTSIRISLKIFKIDIRVKQRAFSGTQEEKRELMNSEKKGRQHRRIIELLSSCAGTKLEGPKPNWNSIWLVK